MFRNPVTATISLLLIAAVLVGLLLLKDEAALAPPLQATQESVRVLRFGYNIPVDSALHEAAARFAEQVAERSEGRIRVDLYPAQQLGTDDQMLEMARLGELDIILTPTAKISIAVPAMQYADLPFHFPAREDLYAMLDGEPGRILLDKLRAIDLVGVTFWENGFKHFTATRPLRRVEDFAGLDMRIMKSRILIEQFRAFGAHSIPIDFHALRQALADGVVDGQENPLVAITSMGLHEVQPHLTLSSHGYLGYVFMISARVFDTLPGATQALLVDTARALTPWERDETHRREALLLETIRQAGVSIHTLDAAERERFAAATAHIAERFEPIIGPNLLALTEELLERKYGDGEHIVIGLDADLSQDCSVAGTGFRRGAALAIEEINAGGGVLGRPLKLIARDHHGLPSVGADNMRRFAARPDVVAMLAGVQAGVVAAQQAVAHDTGLPLLIAWSAASGLVDTGPPPKPVFRVSANDDLAGPYLIERALRHGQRPAILYENSRWGRSNHAVMRARLQREGLDFVAANSFNRGEDNFVALLAELDRAGASALVLIASPLEAGLILRTLAERHAGLKVFSHWGISCGNIWAEHGSALARLDLSLFQTFSFIDNPRPAALELGRRYVARYEVDGLRAIPAPQAVAQAYDLVHLLARAIAQAGTTERSAVRLALENLPVHEGAVRRYAPAFTPDRHDALGVEDYRLVRFAEDGALGALVPLAP